MIELLRKDFRVYRAAFIASVFSLIATYALTLITSTVELLNDRSSRVIDAIATWAGIGEGSAICLAAVFGGCAFAIERRDCSAEFLAMIPISRWRIVASKLIVAASALVTLWIIYSSVMFLVGMFNLNLMAEGTPASRGYRQDLTNAFSNAYLLSTAPIVIAFGVSWFFSVLIKSPAISGCLGLAAILFLIILLQQIGVFHYAVFDYAWSTHASLIVMCAVAVGVVCFIAGTVIFTYRVSP